MSRLFPADFLAGLEALRIEARRVPPRGRHGEHHAREAGGGIEFRDYRPYAPGDDLRRVDWNLFRRFQRVFIRLLDEVRDLPCYLLTDVSASLFAGDGAAADTARRAAAVMAAVSLAQLDAVSVLPFGAGLGPSLPPVEGRKSLPRVLHFLEECRPLGTTNIGRALHDFTRAPHREGLVVLISDFYDPAGVPAVETALKGLRHRLALVRIVRPEDREPSLQGEIRLLDVETGDHLDVAVDERVRRRYRERYEAFEESLRGMAARLHVPLLEVDVHRPLLPQFGPLFPEGVFRP